MNYREIKAEVDDLERRRGSWSRWDRARYPFAIKALRATPQQQALERAAQLEVTAFCKEAIHLLKSAVRS